MPAALTQRDLDGAVCSHPGCASRGEDHGIVPHGKCHPKAGSRVRYASGVITVSCRICKQLVVEIAVAGPPKTEAS